ncbi:XerC Integrase [Methylophilaceae bacterium]
MDWVKDKIQAGLYKRSRSTGEVWAVKARVRGGKTVTITIGKTELFSPQDARDEARRLLALLARGINPSEERKKQELIQLARGLTLGIAIQQYSDIASWKPKTRQDAIATLKRRFSDWYSRPLASITKEECQARFLKIKADVASLEAGRNVNRAKQGIAIKVPNNETGVGEAQRSFRYLSAIFNSYLQDDAGDEKLLPKGNPCDIIKAKKLRRALKPKERFLDDTQRKVLYEKLTSVSHPEYKGRITRDSADLMWLLIHTGLRLDEAKSMLWSSVDFSKEIFTAFDTKNHKNHVLPMTNATKSMFERRFASNSSSKYVFPSPVNKGSPLTASRFFIRASKEIGFDFSAHDFRRTVATVASELGYDLDSIGSVLNHAKKGVTSTYVQHTHKRLKEILVDIQNALFDEPYDLPS